jgi:hypothetical protein
VKYIRRSNTYFLFHFINKSNECQSQVLRTSQRLNTLKAQILLGSRTTRQSTIIFLVWCYFLFNSHRGIVTLHEYPCMNLPIYTSMNPHLRYTQYSPSSYTHSYWANTYLSVWVLTFLQVHLPSVPELILHRLSNTWTSPKELFRSARLSTKEVWDMIKNILLLSTKEDKQYSNNNLKSWIFWIIDNS